MEMNEKISIRRKELGLTLEDVGNAVGVGKSTVKKWESGCIANMRRDKIAKLADALYTTPAYLMGWDEEKKPAPMDEDELDAALIKMLGQLSPAEYQRMQDFVAGMIASRKDGASPNR